MENLSEKTSWKETSLSLLEHNVIRYWRDINAIDKVLKLTEDCPEIIFLDGPPFATGTMHYGHILVSTVKDTLNRYFTMNRKKVDKRNSFDCHGVPIEMLAKEKIGYKTRKELLEYGIDNHNNLCRNMVMECTDKWYKDFERMGRWIDIKKEYKTMDLNFMESVIWGFQMLFKQGMIFEGFKVMPYSTGCSTPLSHFEAKQNYKMVNDQTIICLFKITSTTHSKFQLNTDYPSYILAWTTTPWTLPSNMALCTSVNAEIVYAFDNLNNYYILMSNSKFEASYGKLMHNSVPRFNLVSKINSSDLANIEYQPPFDYFYNDQSSIPIGQRMFRVLTDAFVKESGEDAGTGFVHLAAGYGEEDFRVCCKNNIIDARNSRKNLITIIDDDGCFTSEVKDYAGMYVKDTDKKIIADLKHRKLVFETKLYTHSYPFCYRTDTPLLYRTVSAWFLNASNPEFREKMIANNRNINWMPSNIGTNDFDNWLQGSVDWCISRSRYWGTPIPIWQSDDGEEIICIGSIEELEKLSGVTDIKDLHIETVDKIKIPSREGRGMLSRVGGVLDCWFESGSMPYAQHHYPFENKDKIDLSKSYIADFITESKDQTRGWFYTLTVLATAIFNKPAFGNVIVTGIINASDGHKMSKSKKNYSDPNILMDTFGADSTRLYILSTPVVKAESINFDEKILKKLQQNSIVKLYNMTTFLLDKIALYENKYGVRVTYPSLEQLNTMSNVLDRWIINKTGILLDTITRDLEKYKINNVASQVLLYIEQLTNWYMRMARERLKGSVSQYYITQESCLEALQTLLFVLAQFTKMVAPILPFISETIYQMIKPWILAPMESVHFEIYPKVNEFVFDTVLEHKFDVIQKVITLIRELRDTAKIYSVSRPIAKAEIGCMKESDWDIIQDIMEYVETESNVLNISRLDLQHIVKYNAETNMDGLKSLLLNLGQIKSMKNIRDFINNLNEQQLNELHHNEFIIEPKTSIKLTLNEITIKCSLIVLDPACKISDEIVIRLDTTYTDQVKEEHYIRMIYSAIQDHRKEAGFKATDNVHIYISTDVELDDFITMHAGRLLNDNTICIQSNHVNEMRPNKTIHSIDGHLLSISSSK